MSEMKHSPGPWWWASNDSEESNLYFTGPDGKPDSVIFTDVEWDAGERYAVLNCKRKDRALIAAAPELYEACKMTMEYRDKDGPSCFDHIIEKMVSAIAKAEQ